MCFIKVTEGFIFSKNNELGPRNPFKSCAPPVVGTVEAHRKTNSLQSEL